MIHIAYLMILSLPTKSGFNIRYLQNGLLDKYEFLLFLIKWSHELKISEKIDILRHLIPVSNIYLLASDTSNIYILTSDTSK